MLAENCVKLLAWTSQERMEGAVQAARARRLSRLAEQLSANLSQAGAQRLYRCKVATARERISQLEEASLLRLLDAPETHYRLTRGTTQTKAKLLGYLAAATSAEERRYGREGALAYRGWTALGDSYFPGADAPPEAVYCAPTVLRKTVVDLASPLCTLNPASGDLLGSPGMPLGLHARKFLEDLHAACEGIRRASAAAWSFAAGHLRTIIALTDPARPGVYRSVSSRAFAGKATLVNPQLADISSERFADSLVHEAVHAYLYELEQARPWVLAGGGQREMRSPWTGNLLRIDSYLHACFVWYALAKFWERALAGGVFRRREADLLHARAVTGFDRGEIADTLRPHAAQVHPPVVEQILQLRLAL